MVRTFPAPTLSFSEFIVFNVSLTSKQTSTTTFWSISINFYSAAYQEFGITNKTWAGKRQTPSSDTGLAANTAHRFKVTPDGGSAVNCVFTTDSADTTWGS